MSKIRPCLWFNGNAEEAVNFYVSLFPDSRIDHVQKSPSDNPGGKKDSVLVIDFTIAGQKFQALNGGMDFEYTHALSLSFSCKDQAELDRVWDGMADGGEPVQCGWIKDRYGVSWQVVPATLPKFIADPDSGKATRVFKAMMDMVKLDFAALQAAYDGKSG